MARKPLTPSIRDLARRTGYSTATVSLVLSNRGRASAKARERILAEARKLNYVVNGRVSELMSAVRRQSPENYGVLGLVSLYPSPRPWETLPHLEEIRRGAVARAVELGYRLEPFFIGETTAQILRVRQILETRNIHGLISLGAPNVNQLWPDELSAFAVVTQGLSLATPLHRIIAAAGPDTLALLQRLRERGYRRPAMVIRRHLDERTGHAYAAMFLHQLKFVFRQSTELLHYVDDAPDMGVFDRWFRKHQPDCLVFYHHELYLAPIQRYCAARRLRVPQDLGLACLDAVMPPPQLSGIEQPMRRLGTLAVELLASLLHSGELILPTEPHVLSVDGRWREGQTLRPAYD